MSSFLPSGVHDASLVLTVFHEQSLGRKPLGLARDIMAKLMRTSSGFVATSTPSKDGGISHELGTAIPLAQTR
jgi:hypothetical protein